jgi:tRNA pseudouridine55 synthase
MKNKSYIIANKPIGKTPFEVIQEIKKSHPELKNTKIGYAGRLDPMAEGLLLLLIGEENKKKHAYENLNKTYECEIFFGFATDTYDLMGMITSQYTHPLLPFDSSFQENINDIFSHLKGTREQKYPPYSSARVNGKPLFYWARNNLLETITVPTHQIHIERITIIASRNISHRDLIEYIHQKISLIKGEFRQEKIIESWKNAPKFNEEYPLLKIRVDCSSGTYIRSLAHSLGEQIGIPALAFSIKRTRIGAYTLKDISTA